MNYLSNLVPATSRKIPSEYTISPSPSSHCGPWKIYDAKRKKTGQAASVFTFDRKSLDSASGSGSNGLSLRGSSSRDGLKAAQDEVVGRLKKEASLLARLRHPCVLEIMEPVEETRSGGLQFVTEPVMSSLSTLLAEKDQEEGAGGGRYSRDDSGRRRRTEVEIDELEIQKGLLQIGKALEFLHESANLIHGNLTPDAVMINAKSDWKLCSLGFAEASVNPPLPPSFDARLPPYVQLSLDYAAPDLVLDNSLTPSTDLFSLGLLIIALYHSPHKSPLETHNSASTYRRLLSSASSTPNAHNNFLSSKPLPRHLTDNVLPQLITRRPAGRLSAREFQQSEFFDNILVSTIRFLDSIAAKTPSEKSAFMRGLPKVLKQFSRSALEKKILPSLVEELRDGSLLALVLPNIFLIVEGSTSRLFSDKVLKRLKEVFIPPGGSTVTATSEPKSAAAKIAEREREVGKEGGLTVIIANLELIKEKTTAQEFKEEILPLLFIALESPTHALQDLALRSLPIILPKLDFPTLKNDLFPVVANVFTKTASLGIKIRGLEAFRVLCGGTATEQDYGDGLDGLPQKTKSKGEEAPSLDKYTIQEKVVPLLKGIKTKEPAVMMETLGVFREIGKTCDREVVAMDILPTMWAMSFGPLLGLEQFKSFMSTIKYLSQKIESEQIRKLEELSASNTSAQTAGEFLSFGGAPGLNAMNGGSSPSGGNDTNFEDLVFGAGRKEAAPVSNGFEWQSSGNSRSSTPGGARTTKSPPAVNTGPKFSWSTPSPTVPSTSSMAPMQPSRPSQPSTQSSGMNSFGTLQPTNTSSGLSMQPLQPSSPATFGSSGFGSTSSLRPQQPTRAASNTSTTNTAIDWSAATKPKPSFPSTPMNQMSGSSLGLSNTNGGFGGIAPPPNTGGSQSTILYGQTRSQAQPATTSSNLGFSGFGIAPPPSGGSRTNTPQGMNGLAGMNMGGSIAPPPAQPEKQGLDKYESLL